MQPQASTASDAGPQPQPAGVPPTRPSHADTTASGAGTGAGIVDFIPAAANACVPRTPVRVVVVMGCSGCGKSSVGAALAGRLGCPFLEGDDLHPPPNIAKMAAGRPLDDADRRPWLLALHAHIEEALSAGGRLVVACSALQPQHRDLLRWGAEQPPPPAHVHAPAPMHPHTSSYGKPPPDGAGPAGHPDAVYGSSPATAAAPTNLPTSYIGSSSCCPRPGVGFVLLAPPPSELAARLAARQAAGGHFFPPSLLPSQLDALRVGREELWAHVGPPRGRQGGGDGGGDGASSDGGGGGIGGFPAAEAIAEALAARLLAEESQEVERALQPPLPFQQ